MRKIACQNEANYDFYHSIFAKWKIARLHFDTS